MNRTDRVENSSITRFCHLYRQYPELNRSDTNISIGFDILRSVRQAPTNNNESFPWNTGGQNNSITAWSIVFSPSESLISFRTHRNESIREIRLSDFDFGEESDYLVMDINDGTDGNAEQFFKPYSKECNRNIVRRTAKTFQMSETEQDNLVNLVDSLYLNREMRIG